MRKETSATSTERLQQRHNPSHVSALNLRPCHRDEALPVRNGVLQRRAFCRGWEGTWGCCGQPFWCGSSKGLRGGVAEGALCSFGIAPPAVLNSTAELFECFVLSFRFCFVLFRLPFVFLSFSEDWVAGMLLPENSVRRYRWDLVSTYPADTGTTFYYSITTKSTRRGALRKPTFVRRCAHQDATVQRW